MVSARQADKLLIEYSVLADSYDERWTRYLNDSLRMTMRIASEVPANVVLDVACGTGRLLEELDKQAQKTILIGIDRVAAMLKVAKQRLGDRATLLSGRAGALPLKGARFDLITCTSALHYFPDAELALREMRRVIDPSGNLVITDWCRDYCWMKFLNRVLPWTRHAHVHTFSSAELQQSLSRAGFRTINMSTTKMDWFWGMMTVHAAPC